MVLLLIFVLNAGCLEAGQTPHEEEPLEKAPPSSVLEVESLFTVCVGCHGSRGEGGTGIAPALKNNSWVKEAELEEVRNVIREGRGYDEKRYAEYASTMPSWEETYSEEEITALAEYVMDLSQ